MPVAKNTFFLPGYILLYVPETEWKRAHIDQGKVFSSLLIFLGLTLCVPLNTCLMVA